MRRTLGISLALAASTLACGEDEKISRVPSSATLRSAEGAEYFAHELVVRRLPEVSDADFRAALDEVRAQIVEEPSAIPGFVRVLLPDDVFADQAISRLQELGVTRSAWRNYVVLGEATPNDPSFGSLWGLTKIRAPAAWDRTTGSSQVLVVVTDTGVDRNHPDLAPNRWTNPREVAGNNQDDDGNGLVDDVFGWDFINNDSDPIDDHWHGTHVAGTIGGAGNNGIGVTGVAWTVRIAGAKMLAADGRGSLWAGAQAISYAARIGAKVVNASWGCAGCRTEYVESAIGELERAGGVFVASAGNDAVDNDVAPRYPASHPNPNVIAVAASKPDDTLASFSCWGLQRVHVAAPGTAILSTTPNGGYGSAQGTSMAAPHVSGTAALYYALRPNASPLEVKDRLIRTCTPVAVLASKVACGGRIDVQAYLTMDTDAPAAPSALGGAAGASNDAYLSWTASPSTDVAAYSILWGTAPGSYASHFEVPATETATAVRGLDHGRSYYFAVEAIDAAGNHSARSNEVTLLARDALAPPAVVDLDVSNVPGRVASGRVSSASGEYSAYYQAENAYDGSDETSWSTPGRRSEQEEHLVVALDEPATIERVDLLPSRTHPEMFPVDFEIETSADGSSWTSVAGVRGAIPGGDRWTEVAFAPVLASSVRLRILRSWMHLSGVRYASIAEMRVRERAMVPDGLLLRFTAPGDDPGSGSAVRYDVRWSRAPIADDSAFAAATPLATQPPPLASGLPVSFVIAGLLPESTYWLAMKAADDAGNVSVLSNSSGAATLVVPPAAIGDLAVLETSSNSVTLRWTAPGDNGREGRAAQYDLRVDHQPITPGTFDAATQIASVPAPAAAGGTETFAVHPLHPDTLYYFAIRTMDTAGARSTISNVVSAQPLSGPDSTPPASVADLAVYRSVARVRVAAAVHGASSETGSSRATNLTDGNLATSWSSRAGALRAPEHVVLDLGAVQPVVALRMHPDLASAATSEYPRDFEVEASADAASWARILEVRGLLGVHATWNEWAAPVTYARYLRLAIRERGPAASGTSGQCAVTIGEVEVYALTPELDIDLSWVAPGDDAFAGTAARYELRHALAPITAQNVTNADEIPIALPLPGGMLEILRLTSLQPEADHHFALRAVDDAGNWSGLSNVVSIAAPGQPPAPVTDLRATATSSSAIDLFWTATGDDGVRGTASAYDLRFSEEPITTESWERAILLSGPPAPAAPGSAERMTVRGLRANTAYWFAMKVADDRGQLSLLSSGARAETFDGVAPARIADLSASIVDPALAPPLAVTVLGSSGAYTSQTSAAKLVDGDESTSWLTPGRSVVTEEWVHVSLGARRLVSRMRLRSAVGYTDLFPPVFDVEVRETSNGAWRTAASETAAPTNAAGWHEWPLGATPAHELRISIRRTGSWNGQYLAAIGELQLFEAPLDTATVRLSWTAPGDDDRTGTAARYDLRRSGAGIDAAGFAAAIQVANAPAPRAAGSLERLEIAGLAPDATHCFAIAALDERANRSPLSASPCVSSPPAPAAAVGDLAVTSAAATSLRLSWTAPADAASYDLRMSDRRITRENFAQATPVAGVPVPAGAGAPESFSVTGLVGQTRYWFALRATNGRGLVAEVSNNATGMTLDNVAPTEVTDLRASTNTSLQGSIRLDWTAPGDGETGRTQSYDLRIAPSPITDSSFASATRVVIPAPRSRGSAESVVVSSLAPEALYYAALRTIDASNNVSDLSNVVSVRTAESSPAQVTDLRVVPGTADTSITLAWTAPGDDGTAGSATSYDVRYSTTYISSATFGSATQVANLAAPRIAGSAETVTVTGLSRGTAYYFALRAADERGNVSATSNTATGQTADNIPPSPVNDLGAQTGSWAGQVRLTWTAPGDDGASGTAQAYDLRWSAAGAIGSSGFSQATVASTQPVPNAAGSSETFVATGLPDETLLHFAIRARDDAQNWSAVSGSASAWTPSVAPSAVLDLRQSGPRERNSATVFWTAPGDDRNAGTAAVYDVRLSATPITDTSFASATQVAAPAPRGAGTTESLVISGLQPDSTYHVALKARDDRNNWSPISNGATIQTLDTIPPGAIGDLAAATGGARGSINLSWTATGDDGDTGRSASYEIRRSNAAITPSSWANAAVVTGAPAPGVSGSRQQIGITGLADETTHHFAMRALDEVGNAGPIAASVSAPTPSVAPARVTDLAASAAPGAVTLTWTAPGDDGSSGTAARYDIRYSTSAISTDHNFAAAAVASSAPAPSIAGTRETFTIRGLAESTSYYFCAEGDR